MGKTLRVGVVGTSWWADGMYLPSLKSSPRTVTAAICGRNRARADEIAAKYDIPAVYTDAEVMFKQAGLDAVVIATPDDTHHALTLAALDAGLHVLCEKPLALNAADAADMLARAEAAGVNHMVLFTNRWLPHARYFRDLIRAGIVGRVFHAEFRFLTGFVRHPNYVWRLDATRANGILADLGAHMIDLARWWVGEIIDVDGRLGTYLPRLTPDGASSPANDYALLTVGFVGGAQGVIETSAVAHSADFRMRQRFGVYGEAGTLEMELLTRGLDGDRAVIRAARSDEKILRELTIPDEYWAGTPDRGRYAVFSHQSAGARQFVDDILDGRKSSPSFWDGLKAQRVIDAALASHASGRRVQISDPSAGPWAGPHDSAGPYQRKTK